MGVGGNLIWEQTRHFQDLWGGVPWEREGHLTSCQQDRKCKSLLLRIKSELYLPVDANGDFLTGKTPCFLRHQLWWKSLCLSHMKACARGRGPEFSQGEVSGGLSWVTLSSIVSDCVFCIHLGFRAPPAPCLFCFPIMQILTFLWWFPVADTLNKTRVLVPCSYPVSILNDACISGTLIMPLYVLENGWVPVIQGWMRPYALTLPSENSKNRFISMVWSWK